ncbi:MAG: protein-disulfide reductase DsbD domain-containing protein [Bryobacteraceae bacterium]
MNFLRFMPLVFTFASLLHGARLDPVRWTLLSDTVANPPGSTVVLRLTATIEPTWHLYSLTNSDQGPFPTTVEFADAGVTKTRIFQPTPQHRIDRALGLDAEIFEDKVVVFILASLNQNLKQGAHDLTVKVRYSVCDDRRCLPPREKIASMQVTIDSKAPFPPNLRLPAGYELVRADASSPHATRAALPYVTGIAIALLVCGAFIALFFGMRITKEDLFRQSSSSQEQSRP